MSTRIGCRVWPSSGTCHSDDLEAEEDLELQNRLAAQGDILLGCYFPYENFQQFCSLSMMMNIALVARLGNTRTSKIMSKIKDYNNYEIEYDNYLEDMRYGYDHDDNYVTYL